MRAPSRCRPGGLLLEGQARLTSFLTEHDLAYAAEDSNPDLPG
jgi:hypothetical protein